MVQYSFTCVALLLLLTHKITAWSPNNSYVPANVTCADDIVLVREANKLSENETEWVSKRDQVTKPILKSFLNTQLSNITTNSSSIIDTIFSNSSNIPRIAIGCSGGGYRAMLSGAGMLSGLDNRTDGANEHGLGGILQSATYLAGLSGGNWLVGSLSWNNWTSVQNIVDTMGQDDSMWDITDSIINPYGINIFASISRWDHIADAVEAKQDAGFNVSLTDVWGRALSYDFFPTLYRGGVGYTWSTIREVDVFTNAEMPFPISVSDGRYPGTTIVNLNSTVFEFNPFELGSWDPTLRAFTDIKYLGTNVVNGTPVTEGQCIAGYDNVGFLLGTSSTLFNQFLLQMNTTSIPDFLKDILTDYLTGLAEDNDDISIFSPNPFYKTEYFNKNETSGSLSNSSYLYLVDGGEDDQNIPLVPLLQQERGVDIIFALDSSADTEESWPDGESIVYTYERQFNDVGSYLAFPYVPDQTTIINEGLTERPVFFGCDSSNLTDLTYIPPLVVYIANNEQSYLSNKSTFKMSYDEKERLSMIKNGFEVVTRNNFTEDNEYGACIACAIIRRSQERMNLTFPDGCQKCFDKYCWNGKRNETALPTYDLQSKVSSTSFMYDDDVSGSASASASVSVSGSSTVTATSSSSSSTKQKNGANANANGVAQGIYLVLATVFNLIAFV
ncbi:lysophospholipase family protein SCDLUD_000922 [Saccharomycodes ludwigii]|uniref:lysophospholipase family protein n=1 Tax=Saccharomycodes ludwigii TaxID=36035 RepID=UPI001E885B53|nr:hypothetical protein SCDLUD_000922 [Saccharomycodes ludwigii]KAH3903297.1 hypothetical protein SCDLUD_000922 [Saccharomycodes ludwigii]